MTLFNNYQINSIFAIDMKVFFLCITLLFGLQIANSPAKAAYFDQTDNDNWSTSESTIELGTSNEYTGAMEDFFQLSNTKNPEAIRLTTQGLENLKAGNKKQGLEDLQAAWKLRPTVILAGVMLGLNYLQDKEFDHALQIAKEIQNTTTQDDYGLGFTLEGMVYSVKGDDTKAIAAFKHAIKLIPNEKNSLLSLATLTEKQNNHSEAKGYIQKILYLEPTHLKALEQLAKIEMSEGNTKNASDILTKAINSHPEARSPIIALAENYLKSGNSQQVLVLTENKTDPALLELRGKAYLKLGDTSKAQQTFEAIAQQQPESAPAHYLLAEYFAKTGNTQEATKQVQTAINKNPKFLPARIAEVKTLFYNGKIAEADTASQALIKEFGNKPEVLSISGWLSTQQRDFAKAEKYFEQMSKTDLNTEVVLWWVNSLWAQKKHEQGFTILKDWLANHPEDVVAQLALADGFMGLQKKPEAKAAYLKVIKMQPKLVAAYNNLAWLAQEDDLKQAITYAETALELEKENPRVLDTLGMLQIKNGQPDKAEALLKQASDKAPNNNEILYHLAEILVMQKKYGEAKVALEKLAKVNLGTALNERVKALQATANK